MPTDGDPSHPGLLDLLTPALSADAARRTLALLAIDPALGTPGATAARAEVAMALNVALFADLLARVPTAATYVAEVAAAGERIVFDHGALRTIDGETGTLPRGTAAFARILGALGYAVAGTYPLPRLRMTGEAWVQQDFPEAIPQFFVSALHVDRLSPEAREVADAVFGASQDPLGYAERDVLAALERDGACDRAMVAAALPGLMAAFARQHPLPSLGQYEALLADSKEAGWIATEGNAFNHATTRVPDVAALADRLIAEGKPLKAEVEVSANGRVRQTAFIADKVTYTFRTDEGEATRAVPGSFYEFISRDIDSATGRLDLTFDSANATGIFAVTSAA
jgi:hypothetical protein